jgi:hypothetical protein
VPGIGQPGMHLESYIFLMWMCVLFSDSRDHGSDLLAIAASCWSPNITRGHHFIIQLLQSRVVRTASPPVPLCCLDIWRTTSFLSRCLGNILVYLYHVEATPRRYARNKTLTLSVVWLCDG